MPISQKEETPAGRLGKNKDMAENSGNSHEDPLNDSQHHENSLLDMCTDVKAFLKQTPLFCISKHLARLGGRAIS